MHDEPKDYEATVCFGAETETEDLHGKVAREAPLPSRASLESAAPSFLGDVEQVPPAYSAKHVDGRRSYELARAGTAVEMRAVRVAVHALALEAFDGPAGAVEQCRLRVSCGGGTYVRSLARDLARAAGSAAHLVALRRLRAGAFSVSDACALDALEAGAATLRPALDVLAGYPRQELAPDEVARVVRGIDVEARVAGGHAALVSTAVGPDAVLVAFAERRSEARGDRWQPRVVMQPTGVGSPES